MGFYKTVPHTSVTLETRKWKINTAIDTNEYIFLLYLICFFLNFVLKKLHKQNKTHFFWWGQSRCPHNAKNVRSYYTKVLRSVHTLNSFRIEEKGSDNCWRNFLAKFFKANIYCAGRNGSALEREGGRDVCSSCIWYRYPGQGVFMFSVACCCVDPTTGTKKKRF